MIISDSRFTLNNVKHCGEIVEKLKIIKGN